jgi:uncharacterized membrane protein YhhN
MHLGVIVLITVIIISIAAVITKILSHKVYVILKPLPLVTLFILMMYEKGLDGSAPVWYIFVMAGLGFGFLGDLFLLGKKRIFAAGILSFMLGHVCYIIAFNLMSRNITLVSLLPVIPAILYMRYLKRNITEEKLAIIPAVYPYFGVIVVMCISALNVDLSVGRFPVYGLAGLLFCISDALLIWGSFVKSNKPLQALVLICYYPAQIIIAFYSFYFLK